MKRRFVYHHSGYRAPLSAITDGDFLNNIRLNGRNFKEKTAPWKRQVSTAAVPSAAPLQWFSHKQFKNQEGKDISVHYCQTLDITEKVAQLFLNETVLGFDMEWQAAATTFDSIQDNVSVIQIASRDRIAIFHIAKFTPCSKLEELVSPTLKRIIEDPNILKCGVAIKGDCTRLRKFLGIHARGTFELSHLHKLITWCYTRPTMINKFRVKLTELSEMHLGLQLAKDLDVRCSDWRKTLSSTQAHYAAADAFVGYKLFEVMDAKRKALKPVPPLPAHDELDLPILIKEPEKKPESKENWEADPADMTSAESAEKIDNTRPRKRIRRSVVVKTADQTDAEPVKKGRRRAQSVNSEESESAFEVDNRVIRRLQSAESAEDTRFEPVKRARGRPRKAEPAEKNDLEPMKSRRVSSVEPVETTDAEPAKRKRGRPRTRSAEPAQKSDSEPAKTVRRRARSVDSAAVDQVEVQVEPVKRPRGRPRKMTI
ncbi:ribonuclease H-like domain-containing protein [Aspergillus undulatus]|uniref:ribonuclease H-like domain-containing protein n=1 Tax=Aspergillus undulatus TaxID=1810928 RepID=UPI003CCD1FA9